MTRTERPTATRVSCPGVGRSCGNAHPGTCRFGTRRQAALSSGMHKLSYDRGGVHEARRCRVSRIDLHLLAAARAEVGGRVRERMTFSRCRSGHDHDDGCVFAGGEPVAEGTGESVQRFG